MVRVQEAIASQENPTPSVNLYRLGASTTCNGAFSQEGHSHVHLSIADKEKTSGVFDQIYDSISRVTRKPKSAGMGCGTRRGLFEMDVSVVKRRGLTRVESAMLDCALIATELGAALSVLPSIHEWIQIYEEETNCVKPLAWKVWEETCERLKLKRWSRLSRSKPDRLREAFARRTSQIVYEMSAEDHKKED